jgi:hypothetical protein
VVGTTTAGLLATTTSFPSSHRQRSLGQVGPAHVATHQASLAPEVSALVRVWVRVRARARARARARVRVRIRARARVRVRVRVIGLGLGLGFYL